MPNEEWVSVGAVAVDGGRLLIIDPGHLFDFDGEKATRRETPAELLEALADLSEDRDDPMQVGDKVGIAAITSTGWGDGYYPVIARMTKDGCVAEISIQFIDDDDD